MNLELITGPAGCGKTWSIKERIQTFKQKGVRRAYGVLTASTGIAALNLSGGNLDVPVTTINSRLKYFDTSSLQDNFACRKLHNALKTVAKEAQNLIIDEISMLEDKQLDLIHDALLEVNELAEVSNKGGLGLIVVGDFCQLPPVKGEFAFNAKCFNQFKITKLEKIWRQSDPLFLDMLNAARCGDGEKASQLVCEIPDIQMRDIVDSHFDGTTIVPLNKYVDSLNKIRLDELVGQGKQVWEFRTFRWGRQLAEWKQVPDVRTVCKDAYVMILANDAPEFTYANGSCGYVQDGDIDSGSVYVNLVSNSNGDNSEENKVKVRKVTRRYMQKDLPEGCQEPRAYLSKKEWLETQKSQYEEAGFTWQGDMVNIMYNQYLRSLTEDSKLRNGGPCRPYFDFLEGKWITGEIAYTPVRLAYASTVHKSQGLSLDKVQIDYSHPFFGEPSMSYVALSRCRTPGGLTIVGSRKLIKDRTNITSEILPWI